MLLCCFHAPRGHRQQARMLRTGLWLPSLHHRRMVAAQTVLFKLWYLPVDHPLKSLLPPSAVVRPADLRPTRQSVGRTHTHQLHSGLQIGARQSLLRAFPACAVPVWNSLPEGILSDEPHERGLQRFKRLVHNHLLRLNWVTSTDAL